MRRHAWLSAPQVQPAVQPLLPCMPHCNMSAVIVTSCAGSVAWHDLLHYMLLKLP